jgi:hypothetical protein
MSPSSRTTVVGQLLAVVMTLATARAIAQTDVSGEWASKLHEDLLHRRDPPGPEIGDYTGLPINEAARRRADSWDASILSLPEHQTRQAAAGYVMRGVASMRITKVVNDDTQQVVAYRIFRSPGGTSASRVIWMDGRPHPPDYAAHLWQGFSTGKWEGDALTVETTHIKAGFIQRNGVPSSDRASMTEHFFRHGDLLTLVSIVTDPCYLEEPLTRSSSWTLDVRQQLGPNVTEIVEEIPSWRQGYVPHHLPGANDQLEEFAKRVNLPFEATRGGKETTYPEYAITVQRLLLALPPPDRASGR